jgi:hypothetical protein
VQFSISSVLYNAALSLYYVLIIKNKMRGPKLRQVEKWIHFVPIAFGLTTAISALILDVYNFAVWDCWIAPAADGEGEKLARFLQWGFFFAPLWCAIIFATTNMILVINQVRREEKESMEWLMRREERRLATGRKSTATTANLNSAANDSVAESSCDHESHVEHEVDDETGPAHGAVSEAASDVTGGTATTRMQMKHTKAVAMQGMLYVGAFFITWLFPTISRVIQLCGGDIPYSLVVLSGTFIPSQGIFNAMVYFRIRFIACGNEHPTKSKLWIVRLIISSTICPCTMNRTNRNNVPNGYDVEPPCHLNASNEHRLEGQQSSNSRNNSSSTFHSNLVMVASSNSTPSYPSSRLSSNPSCHISSIEEIGMDVSIVDAPTSAARTGSTVGVRDPRAYYSNMDLSGKIKHQPKSTFIIHKSEDLMNDRDGNQEGRQWLGRGGRVLDSQNFSSELSTIVEDTDNS